MSNCNKISELLSAYIDGEISSSEKEMVENHITECNSCKQKLDIMQKTKDILNNTPAIPVPETLLKDFEEYRKKSEQSEKKVVPLYRNYRLYASVAAIFVFAFVLKSGLWQDNQFVPENLTQNIKTEQSINAPIDNDKVSTVQEITPAKIEEKSKSAKSTNTTSTTVEQKNTQKIADTKGNTNVEEKNNVAIETPAVSDVQVASAADNSNDGLSVAAYDESQNVSPMTRRIEEPATVEEVEVPAHIVVYVAQADLEKATQLLSDGKYFYAQVEQKLNDNFIPFDSNFLSFDESIPHKVEVLVKE